MAKKLIAVGVGVRTKSLSRAEDSAVVLEDGNSPVETGTIFIRIFGHHDAITFTCLFMVVTLSSQAAMSRDILPRSTEFTPINVTADMGIRFSSHSLASNLTVVEDSSLPLPFPDSEESILNLSLSHKNGVYNFLRRGNELVLKYVHQGEPKNSRG